MRVMVLCGISALGVLFGAGLAYLSAKNPSQSSQNGLLAGWLLIASLSLLGVEIANIVGPPPR
jgi:hypothetical protein